MDNWLKGLGLSGKVQGNKKNTDKNSNTNTSVLSSPSTSSQSIANISSSKTNVQSGKLFIFTIQFEMSNSLSAT